MPIRCSRCGATDGKPSRCTEYACPYVAELAKARAKAARRNATRKAREEVLRSLGLVKVRGALGGTYWE